MKTKPYYELLPEAFGFRWGPAVVQRLYHDRSGVVIGIETDRRDVHIRISPTGIVRVIKDDPISRKAAGRKTT